MVNIKQNKQSYDENGKRNGEWIIYHRNGQLSFRWNYVHGIRHGLQEGYGSDGILWFRGYRNMGRRVGYWYLYLQKKYYLCLI